MRVALRLMYDGSGFHGWQVQSNAYTVQQAVQDALEATLGVRPDVTGCSRTDSGVHAGDYCCHIDLDKPFDLSKLPSALNVRLPKQAAVTAAYEVPQDFHARYSVVQKEYLYRIWNAQSRNPFLEGRAYHYSYKLDLERMRCAAGFLVGEHDFSGFMSSGSDIEDTVRDIKYCQIEKNGDMVEIYIAADGFLYNMARIITGTLLYFSQLGLDPSVMEDIIASRDRKRCGFTAPAHGLYLNKVVY
ncbi:MAG: tRNA pseudouridine(38-40) synthase TruA [Eubacteriales bacterium]